MEKRANHKSKNYIKIILFSPLTLLWLAGVFAMIVVSLIPGAGLSELDTGFGMDKAARILTFLLLSFYPAAFFPSIRLGLIFSTFLAPLGFLLEVFQKYVPGRNFSPGDMIANNTGAIIGIFLALTIRFFFRTGRFMKATQNANRPSTATFSQGNIQKDPQDKGVYTPGMKPWPDEGETLKTRPSKRKNWLSRMMTLGLLLAMGYLAWIFIADYAQTKPYRQTKLPGEMSSSRPVAVPRDSNPKPEGLNSVDITRNHSPKTVQGLSAR